MRLIKSYYFHYMNHNIKAKLEQVKAVLILEHGLGLEIHRLKALNQY